MTSRTRRLPGASTTRARPAGAAPRRGRGRDCVAEGALDSGELGARRCVGRSERARPELRGPEPLRRSFRALRALPRRRAGAPRPVRAGPVRSSARQRLHRSAATSPEPMRRSGTCSTWPARSSTRCCVRASTGHSRASTSRRGEPDRAAEYAHSRSRLEGRRADTRGRRGVAASRLHRERPWQPESRARARRRKASRSSPRPARRRTLRCSRSSGRAPSPLSARENEAAALLLGIVPRLNAAAPKDAARAYLAVADIFRAQGDIARALELYELAVEQAPTPEGAWPLL